MTNPAGVKRKLIGVYDKRYCRILAEVLKSLGSEHVIVIHSEDGLDEASLTADTYAVERKNSELHERAFRPEGFGIKRRNLMAQDATASGLAGEKTRDLAAFTRAFHPEIKEVPEQ